jgi:hypothetical protein
MDHIADFIEAYWVILGLTAVLLVVRREAQRRFDNAALLAEASFIYAAYLSYYLVRGLVKDQAVVARENAYRVIEFERDLFMFVEPQLQQFALNHEHLIDAMNLVYVWLHWPVMVIVLVWLFLNHPAEYVKYRNAVLISGALALLIFTFFPVAPPRFMPEFGFVDTLDQRSYSQHVLLPSGLANKYAAVPSLHVGWNLLMALAVIRNARTLQARTIGCALPVLMTSSVVLTGNHYVIDAVAGDVLALTGLVIAVRFFATPAPDEHPPASPPEYAWPR